MIIFVLFFHAYTIYIDCENGNDTNTNGPWKTISKLNNELKSNMNIFLKRGCVWRTPLFINNVQSIYISSYGNYGKTMPKIDCSEEIKGWARKGNLFYTNKRGHLINNNISHTEYFYLEEDQKEPFKIPVPQNFKEIRSFTNAVNYTTIIIRNSLFTLLSAKVVDYKDKEITFDTEYLRYFPIKKGFVFMLTNKKWMIDEKTYSFENNKVFVKTPHRGIRITNKELGIEVINGENITIQNVGVFGCGIMVYRGSNVTIKNCEVENSKNIGIALNLDNCEVNSCTIRNSGKIGIALRYERENARIINNTIINTFVTPLQTFWNGLYFMGHGIYVDCSKNCIISGNTIINCGYIGIALYGNSTYTDKNIVKNSCLVLNDCGAIYLWRSFNHTITENLIVHVKENKIIKHSSGLSNGILIDIFSRNCFITNNTIIDAPTGIFLNHDTENIRIEGNLVVATIKTFKGGNNNNTNNILLVLSNNMRVFYNENRNEKKIVTLNSNYYDINGNIVESIEIEPLHGEVVYLEENNYYYIIIVVIAPFVILLVVIIIGLFLKKFLKKIKK